MVTENTDMESTKTCARCGKKQKVNTFSLLQHAKRLFICDECKSKEEDESDGGGGFQLDNVDKSAKILIDEEHKLEQKREAREALDTRFFESQEQEQEKTKKKDKTQEKEKTLDNSDTSKENSEEHEAHSFDPNQKRTDAPQQVDMSRIGEGYVQVAPQITTDNTEATGLTRQWFTQKSRLFNPNSRESKAVETKVENKQSNANSMFQTKKEERLEKAATERAEEFVQRTWGPGKK